MTTRRFDEQLREYYGGVTLDASARERIRGIVHASPGAGARRLDGSAPEGSWRLVAIAATVALVFFAAGVLMLRSPGGDVARSADAGVSERLAAEVATRHEKCAGEIVFRADDLEALFPQMGKVDFSPRAPGRHELASMKLRGAHYCVLDGQIAIHAVLVDESGRLVSLFETRAGADVASLRGASHTIGGADVELWREGDVLFAVAAAPRTA